MLAKSAAAGVAWALTDDDFSNAFNAISQRGLFEAARRVAPHAPELAACMLRAQCIIRGTGSADMVMRGRHHSGQPDPLVAERYARDGGYGCRDMPAAFAEVVAWINTQAETAMGDVRAGMSADDASDVLWPLIRRHACRPDTEDAPSEWRGALDRLMALARPDAGCGGRSGEMSSAYADDTHSGGWAVACVMKSLRRIGAER